MFGSEYAKYPEILLRQISFSIMGSTSIKLNLNPKLKPFIKLYIHLFGIPEIGMYVRFLHFKKHIKNFNFKYVLDAGCGLGLYSFYIGKKYPLAKIDAVDCDSEVIENDKRILDELHLKNINFFQKDLLELSEYSKYDLIYSIDVLEHIKEDERVIRNIYNALKEGGIFYLHVPQKNQKRHFKRFENWLYEGHARNGYTNSELIQLLEENGFKIKKVKNTIGWSGSLAWELNQISLSFLPIAGLIFPVLLIISFIDTFVKNKNGLCILVIAEK